VVSTYPSQKYEFVSWDDEIPNIWKNNPNVPNHQPVPDFGAILEPFWSHFGARSSKFWAKVSSTKRHLLSNGIANQLF